MKKKSVSRIIALLLASAMCMTACGEKEVQNDPVESKSEETSKEDASEEVKEEEPKKYWELVNEVSDISELPDWEGETIEVNYWYAWGPENPGSMPEGGSLIFKEFERVTGVRFNADECFGFGDQDIVAQMTQIITTEDFPTIILTNQGEQYLGQLADEGYLVDLTPYMDEGKMPNLMGDAPRDILDYTAYKVSKRADGKYYYAPTGGETVLLSAFEANDYIPSFFIGKEDKWEILKNNMRSIGGQGVNGQDGAWAIDVHDDLLTALYPDALTSKEIKDLHVEGHNFTEEEVFDIPLESADDFWNMLYDIKELIDTGDYVDKAGLPMEVMAIPGLWPMISYVPTHINGWNCETFFGTTLVNGEVVRSVDTEEWKAHWKWVHQATQDDVIAQNSYVDNDAALTEKILNCHYAVIVGDQNHKWAWAEPDMPYRPLWIKQTPPKNFGTALGGFATTVHWGIFDNVLTDEQEEQLVRALDFACTGIWNKCANFGPGSLGLYAEDENGYLYFVDEEYDKALLSSEGHDYLYEVGLKSNTEGDAPFIWRFGAWPGAYYDRDRQRTMAATARGEEIRTWEGALNYFGPSLFEEYRHTNFTLYLPMDSLLYQSGYTDNDALQTYWAGIDGLGDVIKKAMVNPDWEAGWQSIVDYHDNNGCTKEAVAKFNEIFQEANAEALASLDLE